MSDDKFLRSVISSYFEKDSSFTTAEIQEAIRVCPATEPDPYCAAWAELKEYLHNAESNLLDIRTCGGITQREKSRVDSQLDGLRLAIKHMKKQEERIKHEGPL